MFDDETTPDETIDAPTAAAEEVPAAVADEATEITSDEEGVDVVEAVASSEEALLDDGTVQKLVASPAKDARYQATGKRKTSVARVILTPGDGTFWVNGRDLDAYFPRAGSRSAIMEPLMVTGALGAYNVRARIHGGGPTGQAGALRHGIAKALAEIDPRVRTMVKSKGMLKVDTRQVERKKAGLKKARKRPQFSKR